MNNKIYVGAFLVGVIVGLLALMALMLVYIKITTERIEEANAKIEKKVDNIYSILDPERVNLEIEVLTK